MADIMTFEEKRGTIEGKKVVWFGDGNNVCHSYITAAAVFDFELVLCCPQDLAPDQSIIDRAVKNGAKISFVDNSTVAADGGDLIVTDTWVSMHDDPSLRVHRHNLLRPYKVDETIMEKASEHALFMHCLPAHRGEEVTDAVMDSKQSVVFDEAENRLHVQKAIMAWCFGH